MSKRLFTYVHCHICPLKDHCSYGDDDASYRYHHNNDSFDLDCSIKMKVVTLNCPLKKLVNVE